MRKLNIRILMAICTFAICLLAAPLTTKAAVDSDATIKGKHAYKVYNTATTFSQAEKECKKRGGHLVTITSSSEQRLVNKLIKNQTKNCYWLGGKLNKNNKWVWVTGENFGYQHWAKGQPDAFGSEDALMMYRLSNPMNPNKCGDWNDLRSSGECNGEQFFGTENFGYVCEWELKSPAKPKISKVVKSTGKITGKASPLGRIYVKIGKKVYSDEVNKQGKFEIITAKLKKGQTIKVWTVNTYNLKSKTVSYTVKK